MNVWPAIAYYWSLAVAIIVFILLQDRSWRFTLRFVFVLMTLIAILISALVSIVRL